MAAQKYDTANGVKPRYDGGGTEFGAMHRDLGPGMLMFDIDGMHVRTETDLVVRNQNGVFLEYRLTRDAVKFVAIFEYKREKTASTLKALDARNDANSMARLAMARALGARLFVVYGTQGKQPFDFYEINIGDGTYSHSGTLYYDGEKDRPEKSTQFWKEALGITRISWREPEPPQQPNNVIALDLQCPHCGKNIRYFSNEKTPPQFCPHCKERTAIS